MTNIFYKIFKEKEVIDDYYFTEPEALSLSIELEKHIETIILKKLRQTESPEAKNALLDVLTEIKNINA